MPKVVLRLVLVGLVFALNSCASLFPSLDDLPRPNPDGTYRGHNLTMVVK